MKPLASSSKLPIQYHKATFEKFVLLHVFGTNNCFLVKHSGVGPAFPTLFALRLSLSLDIITMSLQYITVDL